MFAFNFSISHALVCFHWDHTLCFSLSLALSLSSSFPYLFSTLPPSISLGAAGTRGTSQVVQPLTLTALLMGPFSPSAAVAVPELC